MSIVYLRPHDICMPLSIFVLIKKLRWYMNHAFGAFEEFNVKGFSKMHLRLNSLIMIIHLYVLVLTDNKILC